MAIALCMTFSMCGDDDSEEPGQGSGSGTSSKEPSRTGEATRVYHVQATLAGYVSLPKDDSVPVDYGIIYGTSEDVLTYQNPEANIHSADKKDLVGDMYTVTPDWLTPATTYYYRSYAFINYRTYYGEIRSFRTLPFTNADVRTGEVSDVARHSATIAGSASLPTPELTRAIGGIQLSDSPDFRDNESSLRSLDGYKLPENGQFTMKIRGLKPGRTCYYRAWVQLARLYAYGEVKSFTPTAVTENDAVDLDLPSGTLWASFNIGAENERQAGDQFRWGEIVGVDGARKLNYKWYSESGRTYTKYCVNSDMGNVDNLTELLPEDDAATQNWGEGWQIPSKEQWNELMDECDWKWTFQDDVWGFLVQSKKWPTNHIFLPVTYSMESIPQIGASFWTRTLVDGYTHVAYGFGFYRSEDDKDFIGFTSQFRTTDRSVRAVFIK